MIAEALSRLRACCEEAGIAERAIQAFDAKSQVKLVPRAIVYVDAQRTRITPDGSLVSYWTSTEETPEGVPHRTRRYRSHQVQAVLLVEVTDRTLDATVARGLDVVRHLGAGFYDASQMWVRTVRTLVELKEAAGQTAEGRTTALVAVELAGGLWSDRQAPVVSDIAPQPEEPEEPDDPVEPEEP